MRVIGGEVRIWLTGGVPFPVAALVAAVLLAAGTVPEDPGDPGFEDHLPGGLLGRQEVFATGAGPDAVPGQGRGPACGVLPSDGRNGPAGRLTIYVRYPGTGVLPVHENPSPIR
jgi:hypothetical protein